MQAATKHITTALLAALFCAGTINVHAQRQIPQPGDNILQQSPNRDAVRGVTIPITIRGRRGSEVPPNLIVLENDEVQQILSIRNTSRAPLSIAVLIQDDVVSSIGNEIKALASFIRRLPEGSRVLVGYLRAGSLQIRQRFTTNLPSAANALRIPVGSPGMAPYNPYVQIREALARFESLPTGRRAVLVVSDGLDVSRGVDSSSPTQSLDLQRAINEAQRRSVAIYSFYAPTVGGTAGGNQFLVGNAQGSLNRLSDETGGRAFFQGTGAPVSFDPFLRDLAGSLNKQYALTYLSTHPDKGFRRIKLLFDKTDTEIDYPSGYVR